MQLKPILLNILIFSVTHINADFYAFRKLTHPITQQKVYVLHDAHASVVYNHALGEKLSREMDRIKSQAAVQEKSLRNNEQFKIDDILALYEQVFKDILQQAALIRDNLPNLVRQHKDLADVVIKHNISLINEDWSDPKIKAEQDFPLGGMMHGKLEGFVVGIIGKQTHYKKHMFRLGVSPLFEMGKTLTGKYTFKTFVRIKTNTYFFNPDQRGGASISDSAAREVDSATLKALSTLFTKYNQLAVIVAEGGSHSIRIERDLIKQGYVADRLIISHGLAKIRSKFKKIDDYLSAIENYDVETYEKINLNEEADYKLIQHPLDLKLVFENELKG